MLIPNHDPEIPEMTVEVAKAAFPKGNTVMKIRDELGPLFADDEFAALYPGIGQPAESPARLALVTILQFMENLTDREAANAVRSRIDWKYALGLELTDPGFNFSVFSEFRDRLREHEAGHYMLNKILALCLEKGLLKQGKQRTDSTHVLANLHALNRVELVAETVRHVLNELARIAPTWLSPLIQPEWSKRYARKLDLRRNKKSKAQKLLLAQAVGEDGYQLLLALDRHDAPTELAHLNCVRVMRQIWIQQFCLVDGKMHWRTKDEYGTPPSRSMIASPYELDARYASKGSRSWMGYKIHITETCEDESPRLITQIETTVATTPDHQVTETIQDDLIGRQLQPEQHWVDGGYTDVEILLNSQDKSIDLVEPMRLDKSWQARTEGGYDQSKFVIDWKNMVATCPEGQKIFYWKHWKTAYGQPNFHFAFRLPTCKACSAREKCTRAKRIGRHLSVPPQEMYEALRAARLRQETESFQEMYHRRAGIEGTMGQAANSNGVRRSRYRGLAKTHLQHVLTAAAINLQRIGTLLLGERPGTTTVSHFAALVSPI